MSGWLIRAIFGCIFAEFAVLNTGLDRWFFGVAAVVWIINAVYSARHDIR
jgi:hypothetical protein